MRKAYRCLRTGHHAQYHIYKGKEIEHGCECTRVSVQLCAGAGRDMHTPLYTLVHAWELMQSSTHFPRHLAFGREHATGKPVGAQCGVTVKYQNNLTSTEMYCLNARFKSICKELSQNQDS